MADVRRWLFLIQFVLALGLMVSFAVQGHHVSSALMCIYACVKFMLYTEKTDG